MRCQLTSEFDEDDRLVARNGLIGIIVQRDIDHALVRWDELQVRRFRLFLFGAVHDDIEVL